MRRDFLVIGKTPNEQAAFFHCLHELLGVETTHELYTVEPGHWVIKLDHDTDENNEASLELVTELIEAAGFHVECL